MNHRREILNTANQSLYDLIIVGGGITGSGIVRDAAMRGLKCLLLEKGDFASGTSSRSGKLIHGGLRYLKYLHFKLVFASSLERRRLLKVVAPHLVKPVQFLLPCYRFNRTPLWLTAIGLLLYDILALFRNVGRFRFVSKRELKARLPALMTRDLTGALSYYDCTCFDARLVIDTMKSAVNHGAHLLNYCEVKNLTRQDGVFQITVWDHLAERLVVFRSLAVVNATGAWVDDVLERGLDKNRFGLLLTRGIHIAIDRQRFPLGETVAFEAVQDNRNIYAVPWDDLVLIGTTDKTYNGDKDAIPVAAEDIDYLLKSMNTYFPNAALTNQDVKSAYVGIRPLIGSQAGVKEESVSRDYQIMLGSSGVISITGGKLTTYRSMAKKAVDVVVKHHFQQRHLLKNSTLSPISGAESFLKPAPGDSAGERLVSALAARYGANAVKILKIVDDRPQLAEPIMVPLPYVWAELEYMLQAEYVERVADVVFRRTQAYMFAGACGLDFAKTIAPYIGRCKGWTEKRIAKEIDLCTTEINRNLNLN